MTPASNLSGFWPLTVGIRNENILGSLVTNYSQHWTRRSAVQEFRKVTVWHVMKGTAKRPKERGDCRDLHHQHFSKDMGPASENQVKKGDLMLIYWPGQQLYMGLQEAVEDGPYELSSSISGAQDWPWGLKVTGHWWIRDPRNGIAFDVAGPRIKRQNAARMGLFKTNRWPREGRDWLIREIKKRGEDPRAWSW